MKLKPIPAAVQIAFISLLSTCLAQAAQNPEVAQPYDDIDRLPEIKVIDRTEPETSTGPVNGYTAKTSSTGTKTDTPIKEVPQSLSVVGAKFIKETGATTLADAIAYTPGMSLPWGDDDRYDWVSLRGFDIYTPGFNLDGMLLLNIGGYAVPRREAYGTERVEILRGPSSALYGLSQPGGIVNVISKRPTLNRIREIHLELGEDNHRQIAADYSSGKSKESDFSYRMVGLVQDSEIKGGGLPNDKVYFAPSLRWEPDNQTSLTFLSYYSKRKTAAQYVGLPHEGSVLPNPNGNIPFPTHFLEDGPNNFNQNDWAIGYEFRKALNSSWEFEHSARYSKVDTNSLQFWSDNQFEVINEANPSHPDNFRRLKRVVFFIDENLKSINLDLKSKHKFSTAGLDHKLTLGLDGLRMKSDMLGGWGGRAGSIDVFTRDSDSSYELPPPDFQNSINRITQLGLYVQDQMTYGKTSGTFTIRYDRSRASINNRSSSTKTDINDGKLTGRIGLTHKITEDIVPYVSYSTSFFPILDADSGTGQPFKPETGRQTEVGFRHQPDQGKFGYSVAFYDLRRQNYVTSDPETLRNRQTGEVTARGLEFEGLLKPTPSLNILASYTLSLKSEITRSSDPSEIGKPIKGTPKHQFNIWSDYKTPVGVKLGIGVRYKGSHHGDLDGSPAKVPSYALYDARVSYDYQNWNFAISGRNITNKRTLAFCANWACGYGEKRRIMATATANW